MKALAHVILHQLLFAVWLLAMWVLYCTPACMHPIEHLIAAPFAVLIPAAVKGATTRPLGQSGAIAWNKLGSDVDITPLVSTTLALYGAFTTKRHPGRRQEVMF